MIKSRWKEASTWAGIGVIAGTLATSVPVTAPVAGPVAAICGAIAMWLREDGHGRS